MVQRLLLLCAVVAFVTLSDCYCVTATNEGRKTISQHFKEGGRQTLLEFHWMEEAATAWLGLKKKGTPGV